MLGVGLRLLSGAMVGTARTQMSPCAMPNLSKVPQRRAEAKARPEAPPLAPEIEEIVTRFPVGVRREVRRLVRDTPRLGELAIVFPGAVYALATKRGPAAERLKARSLVEQGAALKAVARALELPLWLKKLPPEAFVGPLGALPLSEQFARRISARMPQSPRESAFWLASVVFANDAAHEDFAIWLAEQSVFQETGLPQRVFGVLAAYAWFSGALLTRAHSLIVVPWRPEIAFDTAVCAAKSWLNRMRLVMQLQPGVITDAWLEAGTARGYAFEPLVEQRGLLDEAQAMQNCADQYAERLARDKCRLFSISRDGTRLATLEIGPHPRETGVLTVVQLKARHNMPASVDIWQAAHAWLGEQQGLKRLPSLLTPERSLDAEVWRQLMHPYRVAKGGAPWLGDKATLSMLSEFDVDMADLARRGGVSSWLFT